jgi:hypothetical protein
MAKVIKKRWMLIFLSFILCTTHVKAQYGNTDRVFWGGLVGGGNFTQVDGDNFAGYHKAGWNAGVIVYASIGQPVALSMELLYAQKGSRAGQNQVPKMANDQSTIITDYKIKLNYAEVPILLNYFDQKKSNFGAGFSYGQLFSSKEIYTDGQGNKYTQDAKLFPFKKFDVNFILNANAHIWKGFLFNLRFQYSVLSVRNAHNYLTGRSQQFNNIWCTRIMYIF